MVKNPDPESRVRVPPVSGHFSLFLCLPTLPWRLLSSTPVNEEVFHVILRRGCKAVGPGGPDSFSLWLYFRPSLATSIMEELSGKR